MRKRSLIGLLILGFLSLSFLNAQSGIYFRMGYYSPQASTFNNDLREIINQNLQDTELTLQAEGFSAQSSLMDKIKGALASGGEIEIFMHPRISLGVGAEYWSETRYGSLEGSGSLLGSTASFNMDFEGKFSLLPILATVRFHLPVDKFLFYLGGGAGYYLSKVIFTELEEIRISGAVVSADKYEIESSGQAILPHLNGGLNFEIFENLIVCLDIRYPLGKISSYEIKKSTETTDVGKKLTYVDRQGKEKNFVLELSGFNFGLIIKFVF